jgi:hypothetical protein
MHRVTDSQAYTAIARAVWLAVAEPRGDLLEPPGNWLLVRAKGNLSRDPGGLVYAIEDVDLGRGIATSRVAWRGATEVTADEALAGPAAGRGSPALDAAAEFLEDLLAMGPAPVGEIEDAAAGAGHAWATVRRAKDRLGVLSRQVAENWEWSLAGGDGER